MRQMLEVGVHFGHRTCSWNPKMAPYVFTSKNKIHIINLERTLPLYQEAVNFLSSVAAKNGKILFVGTKQQARALIKEEANRCQMPYVDHRWLGGMLTNYKTIRNSLKRLQELEALRDSGAFAQISKKEALSINREIDKLEKGLGGIRQMSGLPDALLIIDVGHEKIAVSEANKLRIPVVGIVDTNNSPVGIDYVIPGNDDAIRAIKLYLKGIVDAIVIAKGKLVSNEQPLTDEQPDSSSGLDKKVVRSKKRVFKKNGSEASTESEVNKPVLNDLEDSQDQTLSPVSVQLKPVAVRKKVVVTKVSSLSLAKSATDDDNGDNEGGNEEDVKVGKELPMIKRTVSKKKPEEN